MSLALYNNLGGLRFWNENEIELRDEFTKRIQRVIKDSLFSINPAWQFYRCEGTILTPKEFISKSYDENDIWLLQANLSATSEAVLRPETTASSYTYAKHIMKSTKNVKPPICVWQSGKSFRRETNDGASASKLRFYEFYQLEFQCIYSKDTKADYRKGVIDNVSNIISKITNLESRIVDSDRLPEYSVITQDVEVMFNGKWKEMCSISTRTDFEEKYLVLEIAIGLDRLISVI